MIFSREHAFPREKSLRRRARARKISPHYETSQFTQHGRPPHGGSARALARQRHEGRTVRQAGHRHRQFVHAVRSRAHASARNRAEDEGAHRGERLFRRGIQYDRHRRRHRHGARRHALLAPVARPHRRFRRIHVQRAPRRRDRVHFQLRQGDARHADGGDAPEHSRDFRLRRPDGSRRVRRREKRPDRRDGQGRGRILFRRKARRAGAPRVPDLRFVFRHVHRELHELPQ